MNTPFRSLWHSAPRKLWTYLFMGALAIPFVFPFLWMIGSSLKRDIEVFASPPTLLPQTFQWQNYARVFEIQPFAQQYWNSIYIAVVVTLGTLLFSSLAGYAFARIQFRGRTILFVLLLHQAAYQPFGRHAAPDLAPAGGQLVEP